jgi:hypothetical protein
VTEEDSSEAKAYEIKRVLRLANTAWDRTKRQLPNQEMERDQYTRARHGILLRCEGLLRSARNFRSNTRSRVHARDGVSARTLQNYISKKFGSRAHRRPQHRRWSAFQGRSKLVGHDLPRPTPIFPCPSQPRRPQPGARFVNHDYADFDWPGRSLNAWLTSETQTEGCRQGRRPERCGTSTFCHTGKIGGWLVTRRAKFAANVPPLGTAARRSKEQSRLGRA